MFLFEQILIEAARDRYMAMFGFAKDNSLVSDAAMETIRNHIDWAVDTIKDTNKIAWYANYIKWQLLDSILSGKHDPSDDLNALQKQYTKQTSKLLKKNITIDNLKREAQFVDSPVFINFITHLSSNNSEQVKNIKWEEYTPSDLYDTLIEAEEESIRKTLDKDRIVNTSLYDKSERDNFEVLIQFPDGSMWVNLHKPACDIEAKAMGHCGNVPSQRHYHEVLSYRFPVDEKGKRIGVAPDGWNLWSVRLTFILDTRDGTLGEMKGRFNEKPDPVYHPYIVALLRLPLIKGIVGGGYEPAGNFSISDLSPEMQMELIKEKPALADLSFLISKEAEGIFDRDYIYDRVFKAVENVTDVEEHDGYNIVIRREDIKTAISGLRNAEYYYGYVTGDEYPEVYGYDVGNDTRVEVLEGYLKSHPEDSERLKAYMQSEFSEEFSEDGQYDIDDLSDIMNLLDEYNDGMETAIDAAVYAADEQAVSKLIYESFYEWLNSLEIEEDDDLEIDVSYDSDKDEISYTISFENIISNMRMHGADDFLDDIAYRGLADEYLQDMPEVDTGYAYGHIQDAVEYLNDHELDIPLVPEFEFPEKGKKPEDGYRAFKHFLGGLELHAKDGAKIVNDVVVLPVTYLLLHEDKFPEHVKSLVDYIRDQKASFAFEMNRKIPVSFIQILLDNGFKKTERGYYRLDG